MPDLAQIERMTEKFNEWESCLFIDLIIGDLFRYCGESEDYRKNFIYEVLKPPYIYRDDLGLAVETNTIKIIDEKNNIYQIEKEFTIKLSQLENPNLIKIGNFWFNYIRFNGTYTLSFNKEAS